jgi:hypothetical protein
MGTYFIRCVRYAALCKRPFVDSSLKRISKKYGGWAKIVAPDFEPGERLFNELDSAFCGEEFRSARRFYGAHPELLKPFTEDLAGNRLY